MRRKDFKYRISNWIPLHFRSVCWLTGKQQKQIDYWWQWRDRVYRHRQDVVSCPMA